MKLNKTQIKVLLALQEVFLANSRDEAMIFSSTWEISGIKRLAAKGIVNVVKTVEEHGTYRRALNWGRDQMSSRVYYNYNMFVTINPEGLNNSKIEDKYKIVKLVKLHPYQDELKAKGFTTRYISGDNKNPNRLVIKKNGIKVIAQVTCNYHILLDKASLSFIESNS